MLLRCERKVLSPSDVVELPVSSFLEDLKEVAKSEAA
jgi:hypothetical protein